MKTALITGITGQDGSYLAELLLEKGYIVHGIRRHSSTNNLSRLEHVINKEKYINKLFIHCGDITDCGFINKIIGVIEPDEIYNLAAQSHVGVSFENPIYTTQVNAMGTLYILEAIKNLNLIHKTKFYQASTSELYGLTQKNQIPQNENTPFHPRSPYAIAKLYAYWTTINYREAYNIFACNGILFNHESERRGEDFVTRKVTKTLAEIAYGFQKCLYIGNMNALRDWGHAKDFVEMQWLMLQGKYPEDFVISTGIQHSVREFIQLTTNKMGIELDFIGEGVNEQGIVKKITNQDYNTFIKEGDVIVKVDTKFFRPCEVNNLMGDSSKAHMKLNWVPKKTLSDICQEMIEKDLKIAKTKYILNHE